MEVKLLTKKKIFLMMKELTIVEAIDDTTQLRAKTQKYFSFSKDTRKTTFPSWPIVIFNLRKCWHLNNINRNWKT